MTVPQLRHYPERLCKAAEYLFAGLVSRRVKIDERNGNQYHWKGRRTELMKELQAEAGAREVAETNSLSPVLHYTPHSSQHKGEAV